MMCEQKNIRKNVNTIQKDTQLHFFKFFPSWLIKRKKTLKLKTFVPKVMVITMLNSKRLFN